MIAPRKAEADAIDAATVPNVFLMSTQEIRSIEPRKEGSDVEIHFGGSGEVSLLWAASREDATCLWASRRLVRGAAIFLES